MSQTIEFQAQVTQAFAQASAYQDQAEVVWISATAVEGASFEGFEDSGPDRF